MTAGFTNKDTLVEILTHARSQERCVIEFRTNDEGETTVADITAHVAKLEELVNDEEDSREGR